MQFDRTSRARALRSKSPRYLSNLLKIPVLITVLFLLEGAWYDSQRISSYKQGGSLITLSEAHIVLTRDDRGGNLLLTGQDGGGQGDSDAQDNLVISNDNGPNGSGGNNGGDENLVLQDAENREGDVVISGKNLIIPGEDGHIVLADTRSNNHNHRPNPPFIHSPMSSMGGTMAYWWPYMTGRTKLSLLTGYGGFSPFGFGSFG